MKLIDNIQQAWKLWSVWLAALAGFMATYFLDHPDDLKTVVGYLPLPPSLAHIVIGMFVAIVPTLVRVVKQVPPVLPAP